MAAETVTGCSTVAAAKMMAGLDSQAATASGRTQQGGMQRYDRELKESAAFDSVPGMEMTDGHPYPVYRETDEVR